MAIQGTDCTRKNTDELCDTRGFPTRLPLLCRNPQMIISSLGLGFILIYICRTRSIRPLATAIKVADGAFKGVKTLHILHTPASPAAFIFSAKALIKGYKISRHFSFLRFSNNIRTNSSCHLSRRLKASVSALNLFRNARSLPIENGVLGFLNTGYKISKNSLKVLEGFMGIQIATVGSTFKKGFEGLGLILKAVILTREFSQIAGLSVCRGAFETFRINSERRKNDESSKEDSGLWEEPSSGRFVRTVDSNIRSCLSFNGIRYRRPDCGYLGNLSLGFPFYYQTSLEGEESLELSVSDILCLSLPIHETIGLQMLQKNVIFSV